MRKTLKTTRSRALATIAMLSVLLVAPAVAGTEYEFEVTDNKRSVVEATRFQTDGLNLKIEMAQRSKKDKGGALIFQGDRREGKEPRVVLIDGEGGHIVLNEAKIDQLAKLMPSAGAGAPVMNDQMLEMARLQIEQIPDPEARARAREQFEQRFKSAAGAAADKKPKLEFVERGVREKFGYPCVRYDVMRDGVRISEVWATDWANLEGGRQTSKAFDAFGEFYQSLMDRISEMSGFSPEMFGGDSNPFAPILELGRFPVATYEYSDGEVIRSAVLKSAKLVDHAPGTFQPDPSSVERQFGM